MTLLSYYAFYQRKRYGAKNLLKTLPCRQVNQQ